ncbi:MAG TPA: diguanylate cyclase [Xanthobacteraceae bacterium]|nr:diguanylate cyclase [Xanthobacteraceae bacterium]
MQDQTVQNRRSVLRQQSPLEETTSIGLASGSDSSATTASAIELKHGADLAHHELPDLRAALDDLPTGIVVLNAEMRAQFINRAFRKMWRLPDAKADGKPAFVSLMYYGRDTRAYDVPENKLDAYVAERVAQVKSGDRAPRDLRLSSGEVLRFQCAPLPNGGRMLSYTYVTDIVRHADELETLRIALDNVQEGVMLLDAGLTVLFMNRAARRLWRVGDATVDRHPHYAELLNSTQTRPNGAIPRDKLDALIAQRIAAVRSGDPTPTDVPFADGRSIRWQCTVLPGGGRMLTYSDVSDLVQSAADLQRFATTDGMTELYNRRHFLELAEAEWQRCQRSARPPSLLIFDIDQFKFINDTLGHDAGDRALIHIANLVRESRRPSDILARIGGDEFVLLLPETTTEQAGAIAERLREKVAQSRPSDLDDALHITVSIGAATATMSMAGIERLIKHADEALYAAKAAGRNCVKFAMPEPESGERHAAE